MDALCCAGALVAPRKISIFALWQSCRLWPALQLTAFPASKEDPCVAWADISEHVTRLSARIMMDAVLASSVDYSLEDGRG